MPDISFPAVAGGAAASGNYTLISDQIATGAEGTITLSVTGAYKHLTVLLSGKASGVAQAFTVRYNADSSALYDYNYCTLGNSYSGAGAVGQTSFRIGTTTAGTMPAWTIARVDITDPASANKERSISSQSFRRIGVLAGEQNTEICTGAYLGTAVLSSVSFIAGTSTWASGSRFTLYGLS